MKSLSKKYQFFIDLASFSLLLIMMSLIVAMIIKYFYWKSETLGLRENFQEGMEEKPDSKIAVAAMVKDPKNMETWLQKNREAGIDHFYIRLEDTPDLLDFLQDQKDVSLQVGKSSGTNEYQDIQTRQDKMVNHFLKESQSDGHGVQWIVHMDADELIEGDLDEIRQQPSHVHTFWMQNEEAKYDKIPQKQDNCFRASKFYDCALYPDKCVSYGNGKGGARVCPQTSSNGPHRCRSNDANAKEVKLEKVKVKHFESCDFDSYKKKFHHLKNQDEKTRKAIPFDYYKESIDAASKNDDEQLKHVFTKYRVE
jgi:hypothetical protein